MGGDAPMRVTVFSTHDLEERPCATATDFWAAAGVFLEVISSPQFLCGNKLFPAFRELNVNGEGVHCCLRENDEDNGLKNGNGRLVGQVSGEKN